MISGGTSEFMRMRRDLTDVPIGPTIPIWKNQRHGKLLHSANCKQVKRQVIPFNEL